MFEGAFVATNCWYRVWIQLAHEGWIATGLRQVWPFFFPLMLKLMLSSLWGKHSLWLKALKLLPVLEPLAASVGLLFSGEEESLIVRADENTSGALASTAQWHYYVRKSPLCWRACVEVQSKEGSHPSERYCPWMLEQRLTLCCVHSILSATFFFCGHFRWNRGTELRLVSLKVRLQVTLSWRILVLW